MKLRVLRAAAIVGVALGISACADDPSDVPPATSFGLRVIHASADAPDVNVLVDGREFRANLAYKTASGLRNQVNARTATVEVVAQLPGGLATVIGPASLTFNDGTDYNVIAVGKVGDGTLAPLVIANPQTIVAPGTVRAQVVHAAPAAPEVDVYVTGPNDDITNLSPLGSFEFGENLGPVDGLPEGEYRIRVVATGDLTKKPVFDSGAITLAGGSDLMIVAVENTNAGANDPGQSPISLVVANGRFDSFEIVDVNTPAQFRAVHFSPDTPPVNVLVDDDMMAPNLLELTNVPYPVFSDFISAPAGNYNVKVEAVAAPGAYAIDADVDLVAGKRYSIYAAGYLSSIAPYILEEDFRSVVTEAKVRVVHLAPGAGLVDIYVTAPAANIATVDPAIAGVDFKDETGYVGLAGGSYDVTVTLAGTKTAAIGPVQIDIADGGVYTVVARDAAGGGAPFTVSFLDELN